MCVGDSAQELIVIHAPGRERLLVLYCGFSSNLLEVIFFDRCEKIREDFVPVCYATAAKFVCNRSP